MKKSFITSGPGIITAIFKGAPAQCYASQKRVRLFVDNTEIYLTMNNQNDSNIV